MQWLAMIAILVAQNAQLNVKDKQSSTSASSVSRPPRRSSRIRSWGEALHDRFFKNSEA